MTKQGELGSCVEGMSDFGEKKNATKKNVLVAYGVLESQMEGKSLYSLGTGCLVRKTDGILRVPP